MRIVVLGTGRAGQARIRAINATEDCELVVAETMRDTAYPRSINRGDVDAVIVSTGNARHYPLALAALQAGKHVAVEFPLCATLAEAESLYRAAAAAERVLHVEVISLLSAGFRTFRTNYQAIASNKAVTSEFSGGSYRWVADEIRAGRLGQLAVGRLHVLRSLCGPLELLEAHAKHTADGGYELQAELRAASCRVSLTESRTEGAARGWRCALIADGAEVVMSRATRGEGLFAQDLRVFMDVIEEKAINYTTMCEILDVVRIAEEITVAAAALTHT